MNLRAPGAVVLCLFAAACGDDLRPEPGGPGADPAAPVVAIVAPAPGAIVGSSTVPVRVRLRDDRAVAAAQLFAGGRAIAIDPAALDDRGETTVQVELVDGHHELRLVAADAAGHEALAGASILVDTSDPVAVIVSPTAPFEAGDQPFDVRVRVTDQAGLAAASLAIGGVPHPIDLATLDAAGETTVSVTASAGGSELVLQAIDRAGRSAIARLDVRVDREAPSLDVIAPRAGTAETRRLLFARLADPSGIAAVSFVVNGGPAVEVEVPGAPTTLVVREVLPLVAGDNLVAITVTDTGGHTRTDQLAVHYGLTTSAGGSHSGAIAGGGLQTWGRYNVGQLGLGGAIGDAESRLAPAEVPAFGAPGTTVAAIAFNQNSSLAVRSDGTVWTWGANGDGQLGHGDTTQRITPAQIYGLSSVVYATLGYSHALAIRGDGAVLAWGKNAAGQAGVPGNGTATDDQLAPVVIDGIPAPVVEVVAGSEHSLALTVDGRVFAWGRNSYGNLGNGTTDAARHPAPAQVPGLSDVIDLASGRDHVVALRGDGTVVTWGLGSSGQLGYGENTDPDGEDRAAPVVVATEAGGAVPLGGVRAVFANGNTSYAIVAAGAQLQYWGWGQNFSGQLALGETTSEEWFARRAVVYTAGTTPVFLDQMVALQSIGVGATHTIARTASGAVFSWGWNFRGSLGVPAIANAWAQTIAVEVELAE
ncbi:MAG: RCC1 domain-containing protein [Kofleriaceae bacterium]